MRFSIALALLILALGLPLGWRASQRLASARERHAQLVAKAAQSGITHDPAHSHDGMRVTKRERENKERGGKRLAADFIATAIETEAFKRENGTPDEALQKKNIDLLASVRSLDSAQIKVLMTELLIASKDLKEGQREELRHTLVGIANDHPQVALALFAESANIIKEYSFGKHVINTSLTKWAMEDPMATIEWVRKNRDKFPDLIDRETTLRMLSDAAANHPELALQMVQGLGLEQDNYALFRAADSPKTAEERTATLAAITAQLALLPAGAAKDQMSDYLISGLMYNAAKDGFDAGTRWLDNAGFTPEQLARLADGDFSYLVRLGETGKWIEWMDKTLTGGKADKDIRNIVRDWTEKDHQAAGKWLASTPEGSVKNTSIRSFAETVSKYDPETAAQWAMTLPPGENRANTLKKIYENWPENNEAAKEAFAEKHGLK